MVPSNSMSTSSRAHAASSRTAASDSTPTLLTRTEYGTSAAQMAHYLSRPRHRPAGGARLARLEPGGGDARDLPDRQGAVPGRTRPGADHDGDRRRREAARTPG